MNVEKLDLAGPAIKFLKSQGFEKLYPPQADSIKAGLLRGKSLMVSAPTASGKTLIAMLAMISYLSHNKGKVIYLSPLRALASEKFLEFKKLEKLPIGNKIKAAISTGDFESMEKGLERGNILVMTNEKMDSLIRHSARWIDEIGLVVADEVHLIGDETRGPTLEMVLTQLRRLDSRPQIVALSATITNSDELAAWLDCKLVENDWRPVPLSEGVCIDEQVVMNDGRQFQVKRSVRGAPIDLGVQSVQDGGQSLVFAETRVRSKSLATKASDVVSKMLDDDEIRDLNNTSKKILSENEQTEMVKALALLVKKGVAFHHAGLNQNCRSIIEAEFRRGAIKLLSSTPTLAAGVNLPARRVVISSINRYNAKMGINAPISVLEYKQLCGRAGRPQYDKYGESIIVAGSSAMDLEDHYINGQPEPIESKIIDDSSMRTHLLSVIVTNPGIRKEEILEFFLQTLGGLQSTKSTVKLAMNVSLRFLLNHGLLVEKGKRYAATEFGKKTSMLYIDPATATSFRDAAEGAPRGARHTFGFLHLISESEEFFPKFSLRNKDYEALGLLIDANSDELLEPISEYDCSRSLLALHCWITESTERSMSENLGIESGDMHRMAETARWLSYCLREVSKHAGRADLLGELGGLQNRIIYGINEELLDLVRIKGIGRVRARTLYKHKVRNLDDLRKIPVARLAKIGKIGPTLAKKIKAELQGVG